MVVAPQTHIISVPQGSGAPGCEDTNSCYIPYSLEIRVGDTVSWSNDDSAAHTVTSGNISDGADGVFDSSLFMAGSTFKFTFDEAGTYDYFCMVHPWMTGKIIVTKVTDMIVSEPESMTMPTMEEPTMEESVVESVIEEPTSEPEKMSMAIVSVPVGVAVPGCEDTHSCYSPYEVTISVGESVSWINDDSAAHTVTSGSATAGLTGVFDSGLFMAGSTFKFTFNEAGTYDYFCMVHPWMTGKIIVH
jgi:plastocyanin